MLADRLANATRASYRRGSHISQRKSLEVYTSGFPVDADKGCLASVTWDQKARQQAAFAYMVVFARSEKAVRADLGCNSGGGIPFSVT